MYALAPCTPADYGELLDLLDVCFQTKTHHWFTSYMAHIFDPDPGKMQSHFVLRRDGKLVAATGIYPLELSISGVALSVGGVGSVSVLPEYRGQNLLTLLMQESIHRMRERGFHLSWLAGDRLRYAHFGWDLGGARGHFNVSRRVLGFRHPKPVAIRELDVDGPTLARMARAHDAFPVRILRSPDTWRAHLRRPQFKVRAVESDAGPAYLFHDADRPKRIVELRGHPKTVAALLSSHLDRCQADLEVEHPPIGDPIGRLLHETAGWFSLAPSAQIRPIHAGATLAALAPLLAEQLGASARAMKTRLAAIRSENDKGALVMRALGFMPALPALPARLAWFERLRPIPWLMPQVDGV